MSGRGYDRPGIFGIEIYNIGALKMTRRSCDPSPFNEVSADCLIATKLVVKNGPSSGPSPGGPGGPWPPGFWLAPFGWLAPIHMHCPCLCVDAYYLRQENSNKKVNKWRLSVKYWPPPLVRARDGLDDHRLTQLFCYDCNVVCVRQLCRKRSSVI